MDLISLNLFSAEEHRPFFWPGGRPAAVLIHGFPGTPKEMRPLAQIMHDQGWTVQGLLLPGFGQDIGTLFERRSHDWVEAASTAVRSLQADHSPVLLIGYSMGGAIAINTAVKCEPDGLILLAPFRRTGRRIPSLIWKSVRPFVRTFQPFRRISLDNPRVRQSIAGFLPEADLDSPEVRQALREFRVPTSLIDQLLGIGRTCRQAASRVNMPTIIIQGTEDDVVRVPITRQLLQYFPGPVQYREISTGHKLVSDGDPGWSQVSLAVRSFAAEFLNENVDELVALSERS